MSQEKRGRGRPVTTDPQEVGLTALRLFVERGIDKVTMDEVAVAAGISRSNLFRVFPSKAAVVWGGVERFNEALTLALESSTEKSLVLVLHKSWVNAMQVMDSSLETVRLRLKLISSSPEVYGWGTGQLEASRKVLEHFIAKREGEGVRAKMISSALMAASMAVLTWWAETNDPRHPSEVLDESFAQFEQVFAQVS